MEIDGHVYGSYLLAEAFNSSIFFHPRPSAIGYNLSQSGSYPYSPGNPELTNLTIKYIEEFLEENPGVNVSQIPYAMVSYSASGLDPDIPVQGAYLQIPPRVSTNLSLLLSNTSLHMSRREASAYLYGLVNSSVQQNFPPLFGTYYVNVVWLNVQIIKLLMDAGIVGPASLSSGRFTS